MEVQSVFGFCVRLHNPKSGFLNLNPDSSIERNLRRLAGLCQKHKKIRWMEHTLGCCEKL